MDNLPRRTFIQRSIAALSALALPRLGGEAAPHVHPADRPGLSVQLWTVRQEIEKDLDGTLQKVKRAGFDYVETAFFPDTISIRQAGASLKNAGLRVSSIHCEVPDTKQKKVWEELSETYQCKNMIWHGWPENPKYKTVAGIQQLADSYNEANAFAKTKGLRFGLHNHWWEMTPHADGRLPFAILSERIDKDIFYEIDTYWTKVAGQVPARIISQFADRVRFLHIKDGPAKTPDDSMVTVGTGSQDFPAIAKAAPVDWMVVEFDKYSGDIFDALAKSKSYLVRNGMVKEKG